MPAVIGCALVTLISWVIVGYTDTNLLPVSKMEREGIFNVFFHNFNRNFNIFNNA